MEKISAPLIIVKRIELQALRFLHTEPREFLLFHSSMGVEIDRDWKINSFSKETNTIPLTPYR